MRNINEQIKRINKKSDLTESDKRSAIAELHRRDAVAAVAAASFEVVAPVATSSLQDAILKTKHYVLAVEAKAVVKNRIERLDQLVFYAFVERLEKAPAINGWKPQVRYDIYTDAKEAIRKVGTVGGEAYEKTITALKHAVDIKSRREAIDILGVYTRDS